MNNHRNITLMGLQMTFKCKNCGNCCKNEVAVALFQEDIKRFAKYLGVSYKNARMKYVKSDGNKLFLKSSKPCMFYDNDKKCTIYEARPLICRGYPYLTMDSDFSDEAVPAMENCPGSIETSKTYTEIINKIGEEVKKNPEFKKEIIAIKERYKGREEEIETRMSERLKIKMNI